ncbi:MAG: TQXA domain-containing protein, partial [Catenulispora sp.]|nr:TQXA domain-containing protein [Catenulispora sp.]
MFLGATSAALVAGTAHADGVTGATVDNENHRDLGTVWMSGTDDPNPHTTLIGLLPPKSEGELWTYCIQETVRIEPSELYDEKDWATESGITGIDAPHLQAIKWILNNSYPQLDVAALGTAAHIKGLTPQEAVAGTQAAIWTFSDVSGKAKLDADKQDLKDHAVTVLYNYLMEAAKGHTSDSDQPTASLGLAPLQSTTPKAGDKVGYKVMSSDTTDAFSIALADNK